MLNTTPTDVHLGRIYYEILLDQARNHPGEPIRYMELLERARRANPSDAVVARAIPVSMGRRLEVIVQFVRKYRLPPLTSVVVNETGHPGHSYKTVHGSWKADMLAVANYNWSEWRDKWDEYMEAAAKAAATPIKHRQEDAALRMIHDEYRAGRLPKLAANVKEQLVELLKVGMPFEDAWAELQADTLNPASCIKTN